MNNIYELAHKITGKYFHENCLTIIGARTVGNNMYVKGFDGGFPHCSAYVKVDLKTNQITKYYNAHNCLVEVPDGFYE